MDYEARRDPDAILRQIIEAEAAEGSGRGKLKIFFGYAAGVGKTYAMLEGAHAAVRQGLDVAVGYIEPHTRAETTALLDGLEQLPTREVAHRGIALREFDLDAALARKPQIVLVDEFAHTNAPGSRHKKRYQDVEELLRAGINVFTTVNVQHLESLNDKIAGITHVQVAERIPDRVFDEAASVELVDIEPGDLIERLEAGKVYVPERAAAALAHFFNEKNLAALREIALRRMAERLSRKAEREGAASGQRVEAGESVLVYVTHDAANVKAVRTAASMAERLGGTLTAVTVEADVPRRPSPADQERLRRNVGLAEELGARVVTLHGVDAAQQLAQYAQATGVTHVVVGNPRGSRAPLLPGREGLPGRLMRLVRGAVVDVVPTSDLPAQYARLRGAEGLRLTLADVGRALAAVAVSTGVGCLMYAAGLPYSLVLMLYLVMSLLLATRADGFLYAPLVAVLSTVAYNFFFTVPRFTMHASGPQYAIIFAFLLVGTLVASTLTVRARRQALAAVRRAYRTEVLLESNRRLQAARTVDECFGLAAEQVIKLLNRPVVMYRADAQGHLLPPVVHDAPGTGGGDASDAGLVQPAEAAVAAWVAANRERAGATTDTLADARCLYVPVQAKDEVFGVCGVVMGKAAVDDDFGVFEKDLLLMIVGECGQAAEQIALSDERRRMEVRMEKERLRSNLLRTISHDLRTPLTSISGDADMLLHSEGALSPDQRRRMLGDIHDDAQWLIALVENLLSITRIDEGSVRVSMQPELVADVVGEALQHVDRRAGERRLSVEVGDDLLMANMDARLVVQVVVNLVNNAVEHTQPGGRIAVAARAVAGPGGAQQVRVSVTDDGPGVPEQARSHLFDLFYNGPGGTAPGSAGGDHRRGMGLGLSLCRSIVELHGGVLDVRNVSPHGSEFWFTLPAVDVGGVMGQQG